MQLAVAALIIADLIFVYNFDLMEESNREKRL
ncbi:Uncharacterised protein [uncultured archaeon]|nr:Uncharacterised protein [uncultured archaeon]